MIFVPLLGLAAPAAAIRPVLMERHGTGLGAFAVVTLAAALLTAGAGEAFADSRQGPPSQLLHEHAEAEQTLRLFVVGLTAVLAVWMLGRRRIATGRGRIALQLLTVLLAAGSIFFVLRAGHFGAELVLGPRPRRLNHLTVSTS